MDAVEAELVEAVPDGEDAAAPVEPPAEDSRSSWPHWSAQCREIHPDQSAFLGEERVVVYDMPGTTRDSIYITDAAH